VDAERPLRWAQRPVLHAVIVNQWRNRAPEPDGERVYLTNAAVSDPWTVVDGYDDRSWIENGLFRNSKQFWRLTRWFPQKTAAGVHSHLTFVVMVLAVATAYRLWDKTQTGAAVEAPDHQIAQVVHKVLDPLTGEVSVTPEPQRRPRTHLASRVADRAPAPAASTGLAWSHEQLAGQVPLRWRRQLQRENRDKVIVSGISTVSSTPVNCWSCPVSGCGNCPHISARGMIFCGGTAVCPIADSAPDCALAAHELLCTIPKLQSSYV
jgi:hypothetical protein